MKTWGERFEDYLYKIGLIPWLGRKLDLIELDNGEFLTAKELMAFPPATHGTPTQKVDEVLESLKPLLLKIQHEAGIDDRLTTEFNFNNLYLDVIKKYAAYIHLLPASENWHHSEHGGLLYHSLETSLEALKFFNNAHFRRYHTADIEVLRKPRWKYATWLAALLHDAGKPISDCRVICMKQGIIWPPHMMSLIEWSELHNVQRYKVAWKPERIHKEHESLAIHMLPKILTEDAKRFLTNGPDDVYDKVGRVLADLEYSYCDIATAVRTADSRSTARNIQKTWDRQLGEKNTSTIMLIVKGLRAKLSEWKVNEPKGHVWIINKEVYLAWPKAIQEVIEYLRKKEVVVPADTNTVYNMLYENHIIRNPDKDSKTTLFLPGEYSEDDAKKIRDNNVPVQWEFLVRVVWADYVFEGVPMPNSMNGILKLNKNFDMILVGDKGVKEIPTNQPVTPPAQSQPNNNQSVTPLTQSQPNNNQSVTPPAQSQPNNSQTVTPPTQSQLNNNQPVTPPAQSQANSGTSKPRKNKQQAATAPKSPSQTNTVKSRKNKKQKTSENDISPFNPVAGTNFSELVANPKPAEPNSDEGEPNTEQPDAAQEDLTQASAYSPSEQFKQIKEYLAAHPDDKSIIMIANGLHYLSPINALKVIPTLGKPKDLMNALQDNNELEKRNPELINAGNITCNAIRLTDHGAAYITSQRDSKAPQEPLVIEPEANQSTVAEEVSEAVTEVESKPAPKKPTATPQSNAKEAKVKCETLDLEDLLRTLASHSTPDNTIMSEGKLYVSIDLIDSVCQESGGGSSFNKAIGVALGNCKMLNDQLYNEINSEYIDRFQVTENEHE